MHPRHPLPPCADHIFHSSRIFGRVYAIVHVIVGDAGARLVLGAYLWMIAENMDFSFSVLLLLLVPGSSVRRRTDGRQFVRSSIAPFVDLSRQRVALVQLLFRDVPNPFWPHSVRKKILKPSMSFRSLSFQRGNEPRCSSQSPPAHHSGGPWHQHPPCPGPKQQRHRTIRHATHPSRHHRSP